MQLWEVAIPMGLAIFKGTQDRLKDQVIGSGQSHGTCHFDILEVASPIGLALIKGSQDRLKDQVIESGQSHGTGTFLKGLKTG